MYCSAPFTSCEIKTNGLISYCCVSNDPLGNYINDSKLVQGRQSIIDGKILKGCNRCFNKTFTTVRETLTKNYPIKSMPTSVLNLLDIQYIDVRMGNVCNFTCLMCGPNDSHLWGSLVGRSNVLIDWEDEDKIINFIKSCKNLKTINFAGGEPFYNLKRLYKILSVLDRSVKIKFITNVSVYNKDCIKILNEFSGQLNCSLDGIGRFAETQRFRSNWKQVESNFKNFCKNLNDDWNIQIASTWTIFNIFGAKEFTDWIDNINKKRTVHFNYTFCDYPEFMSIYSLSPKQRKKIAKSINGYKDFKKGICANVPNDKNNIFKIQKFIETFEEKTNFNIHTSIPELREVLHVTDSP